MDKNGENAHCFTIVIFRKCIYLQWKTNRSFSTLSATVWNGLPLNTRLDIFKRRLKTNLFKIAHQHPYHTAHHMTAGASDSVSLLKVRALYSCRQGKNKISRPTTCHNRSTPLDIWSSVATSTS